MREFSDFERKIIRKIVDKAKDYDIQQLEICKVIREITHVEVIEWEDEKIRIYYKKQNQPNHQKLFFEFYRTVLLLRDLEEAKIIYTTKPSVEIQDRAWFNREIYNKQDEESDLKKYKDKNGNYMSIFTDFHLSDLPAFLDYFNQKIIIPSLILEELIKNDFKTQEQIRFEQELKDTQERFKKELCLTRKTVWISIIALILSVGASIFSIFFTTTKIESIQFDRLNQSMQNISTSIDSIHDNKTIYKGEDAINTQILEPMQKQSKANFRIQK